MGRIKKALSIQMPMQHMHEVYGGAPPFQDGNDLASWLNEAQVGPPAGREATSRIRNLILRMHNLTACYQNVIAAGCAKDFFAVGHMGTLRVIEPFYTFNFDLFPPLDFGKWRLQFIISFSKKSGDGKPLDGAMIQEQNIELGAVAAVVDLALNGRLETIRQCEVPECGTWFTARNDPRLRCCPAHDVDDLRRGTPKRKAQVRQAAKNAYERVKRGEEKSWTRVGKPARHKAPARRTKR